MEVLARRSEAIASSIPLSLLRLCYNVIMTTIDAYLEAHATAAQRAELERVRAVIHAVVPEAEETISYQIPTFKYKGKNLIHFAAFTDHLSLFPTAEPIAALAPKLAKYKTGKGTLQFSENDPIPNEIIKELVHLRLLQIG